MKRPRTLVEILKLEDGQTLRDVLAQLTKRGIDVNRVTVKMDYGWSDDPYAEASYCDVRLEWEVTPIILKDRKTGLYFSGAGYNILGESRPIRTEGRWTGLKAKALLLTPLQAKEMVGSYPFLADCEEVEIDS